MDNDNLNTETDIKNMEEQSLMERVFEKILWSTRYTVILAVVFSVLGSVALFVLGSYEIMQTLILELVPLIMGDAHDHSELLYKLMRGTSTRVVHQLRERRSWGTSRLGLYINCGKGGRGVHHD